MDTPIKKQSKSELTKLSELLALMKDSGVQKFKYKDVEVEFEITPNMLKAATVSLDDETERTATIREALKAQVTEDEADLLWST